MSKKEGRDLVSEAVSDAKALREAAVAAAKNQLLESMAPAIKELLEKNIRGVLDEKRGLTGRIGMSQRGDYMDSKTQKWEEDAEKGDSKMAKDEKKTDGMELDLESLANFFPGVVEAEEEMGDKMEEDPSSMMQSIPTLGEGEGEEECAPEGEEGEDEGEEVKKEAKDKEEDKMDEEIEISEAELKKVYEAALQTEVQVKKGFSDMTKAGELDDVVKDTGKGLNPEKKGETAWEKGEVEDKKDFTVKEAIAAGRAENKALRENLKKAVAMIRMLGSRLHETNLFNAKVLHVNRVLNTHARLTAEQRKVVLESIDKAKTIDEVRMVFEAISNSFTAAARLSESKSRKPAANAQRPRTSGSPDQKVLSESVDRDNGTYSRLSQLAGLGNLK